MASCPGGAASNGDASDCRNRDRGRAVCGRAGSHSSSSWRRRRALNAGKRLGRPKRPGTTRGARASASRASALLRLALSWLTVRRTVRLAEEDLVGIVVLCLSVNRRISANPAALVCASAKCTITRIANGPAITGAAYHGQEVRARGVGRGVSRHSGPPVEADPLARAIRRTTCSTSYSVSILFLRKGGL